MSQREMLRLYSSVDAFVLASHGEGWGLPYMEAMAAGLPCIATNWSGMTEFMNDKVALLLNYTLGPAATVDKWFQGTSWANPDTGDLRRHMRWLYENPDQGKAIGAAARKHIQEYYDNSKVGLEIEWHLPSGHCQLQWLL
jgi:glycosyltransferase involved in cell wall biosynthesis